jgi:hypothetical protein
MGVIDGQIDRKAALCTSNPGLNLDDLDTVTGGMVIPTRAHIIAETIGLKGWPEVGGQPMLEGLDSCTLHHGLWLSDELPE